MIVGDTIFKMGGNPYYTPEFPRAGLAALFSINVVNLIGGANVTVTVEHRAEDQTSWNTAGTFPVISTTGVVPLDVTNIQEIVRLKLEFAVGDPDTAGVHFFVNAPAWRPYP